MLVHVDGEGGQLWRRKPIVDDSGHVVSFTRLKDAASATFTCVAFAATTSEIVAGDNCGYVWAIRLKENRFVRLACCGPACSAVSCHPSQNNEAIVGYANGQMAVFNIRSKESTELLRSHRSAVTAISYSFAHEHMASISREALVIWSTKRHTKLRQIEMTAMSTDVAFTPQDETVVTITQDGTLSMWTSQGILTHQLDPPPAMPSTTYTLAVAPNGLWLAAAPRTALLLLYDLRNPRLVTAMHPKNQTPILQLSFLSDSRTLAVLTSDSQISFTDVESARHLFSMQLLSPSAAMFVERRGNYAAAITTSGTISLHDVATVREAAALVPPPPGTLSTPNALKRTAPQELAELDLRPLPPQRPNAPATSASAPRGRAVARGTSPHAAGRSRSGSWGRGRPPRSVPRPRALSSESSGGGLRTSAARTRRHGGIVRPSSISPGRQDPRGRSAGGSVSPRAASPRRSTTLTVGTAAPPLSLPKLKKLLVAAGEFPAAHRAAVWAFLLRLPGNTAAFEALRSKGAHECVLQLEEQYPLQDTRLQQRLAALLSQLAHWCPLFAEVSFLPSIAFPLLKVFRAGGGAAPAASAAFEAAATLVSNWARGWFAAFPHPPLGLLQRFERLLAVHDAELAAHVGRWPGGAAAVAWELLSTLMTDVLDRSEWLQVWDHVLCNPPWFFPYVVLAYLLSTRVALLRADSPATCAALSGRPHALDVRRVLRRAAMALETTPADARLPEEPLRPLLPAPGAAAYAPFAGEFPPQALQAQRGERVRLLGQRTAIVERRRTLSELQDRGQQLAADTAVMLRERQQLAGVASERRAALTALEERMARERALLEAQSKAERLRQISLLEDQYAMHLQRTREEMRSEVATLERGLARRHAQRAAELRGREQEEALRALEFESRQRIWAMEQAAARDAALGKLRAEAEAKEAALDAQHSEALAEMAAKDESMALQAQHDAAKHARVAMAAEAARAAAEVDAALVRRELQQAAALRAAAAQQRLRTLAERAAAATAAAVAAERDARGCAAQQRGAAALGRAAADRAAAGCAAAVREGCVETELQRLAEEQREREVILRDVELAEAEAEAEARVLEARAAAAAQGVAADGATRGILAGLRGEVARTRAAKVELRAQEEELREYIAELRAQAPGAAAEASGAAAVSGSDSGSGGVLRDVSNASGGGHDRANAELSETKTHSILAVRPQQPQQEYSESSHAESGAPSDAPGTALVTHRGSDTEEQQLLRSLPALARTMRAAMHELDAEGSETFSERCNGQALCGESLPELAKALQAKVRELARMHEVRAANAASPRSSAAQRAQRAQRAGGVASLREADESHSTLSSGEGNRTVARRGQNVLGRGGFGSMHEADSGSADSATGGAATAVTPLALTSCVSVAESVEQHASPKQRPRELRRAADGAAAGALTHGEADEDERRGDAAAVRAVLAALASQASCMSEEDSSGACGSVGAGVAGGAAPGSAAVLAAQLSGLLGPDDVSACGDACSAAGAAPGWPPDPAIADGAEAEDSRDRKDTHEAGATSEEVAQPRMETVRDEPEAGAGGEGAAVEGQTLRQELLAVRGMIAEMRELRDAVASGGMVAAAGSPALRMEDAAAAAAHAEARHRAHRSGVAPGFLTPGMRTGRGGHAFFVGADASPPPSARSRAHTRSGHSPSRADSGRSGGGGRMFFVDVADGPKKAPPKPPQPGFMRSAERKLRVNTHVRHAQRTRDGRESPTQPAESETSSSVTPAAEEPGTGAGGGHAREISAGGGGRRRSPGAASGLRPWQRHVRAAHAAAATAKDLGRSSGAAAVTASPLSTAADPPLRQGSTALSEGVQPQGSRGSHAAQAGAQHAPQQSGDESVVEAESLDLSMTLSPSAFSQEMRQVQRAVGAAAGDAVAVESAQAAPKPQHATAPQQDGDSRAERGTGGDGTASHGTARRGRESGQPAQGPLGHNGTMHGEPAGRAGRGRAEDEQAVHAAGPQVGGAAGVAGPRRGEAAEQMPRVGQGADEAARMLAELVAEHEDSLMDTAHSSGSAARSAGTAAAVMPPQVSPARSSGSQAEGGGGYEQAQHTARSMLVTPSELGLSSVGTGGGADAVEMLREGSAGAGDAERGAGVAGDAEQASPGRATSRSRSPRVRGSRPESPPGPDLEQLMAGLRAQLAGLPMSPRSAAERRRGTAARPVSAPPSPSRLGDAALHDGGSEAGGAPDATQPPSQRTAQRSTHSMSPQRTTAPSAAAKPLSPRRRSATEQLPAQTAATSIHGSPSASPRTARSTADRLRRGASRSPPASARTARSTATVPDRETSRSPPRAARSTADRLHHSPSSGPPASRVTRTASASPAAKGPAQSFIPPARDVSLRHMHEHPAARHETSNPSFKASERLRPAGAAPRTLSLDTWPPEKVRADAVNPADHRPSRPLRAAPRTLSLSRDSLVAPDEPSSATSAESDSADGAAWGPPAARSVLRASSTLRESTTMPAVPEDAALEGPVQSPVREFLERSSGGGGGGFVSAARREARRVALYAPQPGPRSDSETTAASAERRSLSLRGARPRGAAAGASDSAAYSHGSTSVVNSSEFHNAYERGHASEDSAPFDVGRSRPAPSGAEHTRKPQPSDHAGRGGGRWDAERAAAAGSGKNVLESDDSSISFPAPTLRPSSLQGASTVLISNSSVSSDAANPISTPKKKQRCTTEATALASVYVPSPLATRDTAASAAPGPLDSWPPPPAAAASPLTPGTVGILATPPPDPVIQFSPSCTNVTESLDFTEGFPTDVLGSRFSGVAAGTAGGCPSVCMPSPLSCDPCCLDSAEFVAYGGSAYEDCAWQYHC